MIVAILIFLLILVWVTRSVIEVNKTIQINAMRDYPACPPHKWRHMEIKDKDGNTVRRTTVCDRCGPLRPLDTPKKMDY